MNEAQYVTNRQKGLTNESTTMVQDFDYVKSYGT